MEFENPIAEPDLARADGLFYLPPTVMQVSRGAGAEIPLRYFCRPEVVVLTLSSETGV